MVLDYILMFSTNTFFFINEMNSVAVVDGTTFEGYVVLWNLVMQFVALTQPLNAFAFVFDGLHYGASDFAYAAVTMVS